MKKQWITAEQTILFNNSLSKNYHLLINKGFTDKGHFPYTENFLLKKLEHKLQSKLNEEHADPHFLIRLKGCFDTTENELNYNLFYKIDRINQSIKLDCLVADLNDKRICYPLKDDNDLPPAINIWNHLTNAKVQEKVRIIYPKEQIKLLLREQDEFLKSIGYYKTFLDNRTIFINRELKNLLQANLHEFEPKVFPINVHLHLNSFDSMNCRFEYQFDPIQIQLTLKSITAHSGASEINFSIEDIKNQKLDLQKISDNLREHSRLLTAKKISEGPQEMSGIRALLKHLQKRP
jgi:hypothetical protein